MGKVRRPVLVVVLLLMLGALGSACRSSGRCKTKADCQAGQLCVPTSTPTASAPVVMACVAGAECATDADCDAIDPRKACVPATHACVFRPGFADQCGPGRPCSFGQFCSTLLGRCLDAASARDCARRGDCPEDQLCDTAAGKCVADLGCYGPAFCDADETCDLVGHTCQVGAVRCESCLATRTCAAGQTCSATAECLAAGAAPSCAAGETCDSKGRCAQCTASAQCGAGLFCNLAAARCESAVQCAPSGGACPDDPEVSCVPCAAPQVCDPVTRTCAAPVPPCGSDIDCPGDAFCNLARSPPACQPRIPSCLADAFDVAGPHATPASAARLPDAEQTFADLDLCPGSADWYALHVAAGTYLTIDARFARAEGDLDLELYLEDGTTLVAASRSVTGIQRVELGVGAEVTLLLRVLAGRPSVQGIPYSLVVARDPGALCPDDGHGHVPASAGVLPPDTATDGRICPAVPDWFVLPAVPAGLRIEVALSFPAGLGQLGLELYPPGATRAAVVAPVAAGLETLVFETSAAGDHRLRIVGRGADQNVFTVRAALAPAAGATCRPDPLEPNDTPPQATSTATRTGAEIDGLSICAADEDWFSIPLASGDAVTGEVSFASGADLVLSLYAAGVDDPRVTPLRAANGPTIRDFIAYRAPAPGTFLLRVRGHTAQDAAPYALRLQHQPPLACAPDFIDRMSSGDTSATAFPLPLPPLRLDGLSLCGKDADWFRVRLPPGFTSVVRIQYIESDAVLDLVAQNDAGNMLAMTAETQLDAKEIHLVAPEGGAGSALVAVVKTSGGDVNYTLTQDLVPHFACAPDFAEPDDTVAQASRAASSTAGAELLGLTLCASTRSDTSGAGDEDWYVLRPPRAGATIAATITFPASDLFLELLGPSGRARACAAGCYADGDGRSDTVTFTATTTAPYYLRVGSIYASPRVMTGVLEIDTPYALRVEYR